MFSELFTAHVDPSASTWKPRGHVHQKLPSALTHWNWQRRLAHSLMSTHEWPSSDNAKPSLQEHEKDPAPFEQPCSQLGRAHSSISTHTASTTA
ncbi:hypothetical protein EYF80_019785 [Liparis tanakae]|uniref:Uncharacterized protein n=1 Tax=Liparis tanakae TaxID=230148 RepID=A0A4Z2HYA5_9TELE|nr:hypothetical protein EYF80_019785 [Liparis tanakae]